MRAQLLLQQDLPGGALWRVCEADGEPVTWWLPGEPFEGALDRGGFRDHTNALAFKLGVDWVRAEAGLLGETVADIEAERAALDRDRGCTVPSAPGLFEAA